MSQPTPAPVWEYNGVKLTLDMNDADTVELYENTFEKMQSEIKGIPKDGPKSDIVRAYCKIFRNVFDRIFGEGTSKKLVEKDNTRILTECYESFLDYVSLQNDALGAIQSRITSRYSPNRAQRRAAEHAKPAGR